LVTAPPAGAQTREQKAGARAAADAGGDAFDAGRFAEAADLFERAERLMHAPPHLLYAARSHVKLGHLVEARELYLALTREQLGDAAPRAFRDAQRLGEKELAELEPRLSYISVVVQGGGGATSVRVTRNGEPVPAELLGIPTPINPGDYSYQALADGMESTATTVKLGEGVRETVVLTLRDVPGGRKTSAPGGAANDAASGSLTTQPAGDDAPGGGGGRPLLIGSIAGFAVAAAGSIIGTVFILKSSDTDNQADTLFSTCGAACEPEIKAIDNDAATQRGVAIAGFVSGGVGLAAGITLLVMDQNRSSVHSRSRAVSPVFGLNYVGLTGRF
jgi:hypothetical protein